MCTLHGPGLLEYALLVKVRTTNTKPSDARQVNNAKVTISVHIKMVKS